MKTQLQFTNFNVTELINNINKMSRWKTVFLHLRLPFSYFLLPVFVFGLSQSVRIDIFNTVLMFFSLHFFIYPGSNSYNSFMDKDSGSIGVLRNPPPVNRDIYFASIVFDIIGLSLMLLIDIRLVLLMLVYVSVSKAYSWTGIRLKRYPITGWLFVILFQGGFTFLLVSMAAENNFSMSWLSQQKSECILLSTLLIGAYYPLTQIYQHDEDSKRGDKTISYLLGIRGTFIFSALLFMISFIIAYHYYLSYFGLNQFLIFMICLVPAIVYFMVWAIRSFRNSVNADYKHAMRMTLVSSTCLLIRFIIILSLNH